MWVAAQLLHEAAVVGGSDYTLPFYSPGKLKARHPAYNLASGLVEAADLLELATNHPILEDGNDDIRGALRIIGAVVMVTNKYEQAVEIAAKSAS